MGPECIVKVGAVVGALASIAFLAVFIASFGFAEVEDKSQWLKVRVQTDTSDGRITTLVNQSLITGNSTKVYVPTQALAFCGFCGSLSVFAMCLFAWNVLSKPMGSPRMEELSNIIQAGAKNFMLTESKYIVVFAIIMAIVIGLAKASAPFAISYLIGALFSFMSGFIGMMMATRSNGRTASACWTDDLSAGLLVAFRGGAVMGQAVVGLGILGVALCYAAFGSVKVLAGYGAGASTIALFARVAGGIYTKAADVGADLVGKVVKGIPEDDARNPATIADNVGDNVGDIAGMGADLFESFVGGIIAACVLGTQMFGKVGAEDPPPVHAPQHLLLCLPGSDWHYCRHSGSRW